MVSNGLFMAFMVKYRCIDVIGLVSSFLAVIDPNSFSLVFSNDYVTYVYPFAHSKLSINDQAKYPLILRQLSILIAIMNGQ